MAIITLAYREQCLKSCPYCGEKVTDNSYDRKIVFRCKICDWYKDYPGIIQTEINSIPIPYSDGKGGILDPSLVKNQEYYHQYASDYAVEKFNEWVDAEKLIKLREEKINNILT